MVPISVGIKMSYPLPSLVVFGPQASWPNKFSLSPLHSLLVLSPDLQTFRQAIQELPDRWERLVGHDPFLAKIPGREDAEILQTWARDGVFPFAIERRRNTLCSPMTVVIQFLEYYLYLKSFSKPASHADVLKSAFQAGFQGLCLGLLTAAAAASAKNDSELIANGCNALRLALCIGAYIDLEALSSDAICVVVRGTDSSYRTQLRKLLEDFPTVSSNSVCQQLYVRF